MSSKPTKQWTCVCDTDIHHSAFFPIKICVINYQWGEFKLTPSPPAAEDFGLAMCNSLERLLDRAWPDACDVFKEQKNAPLGSVTISQMAMTTGLLTQLSKVAPIYWTPSIHQILCLTLPNSPSLHNTLEGRFYYLTSQLRLRKVTFSKF